MRYTRSAWVVAIILTSAMLSGCVSDQQKINDLVDAGEVDLGGHRYDMAVAQADEALHIAPSAKAYYLRGCAEEDRPKPDALMAAADLNKAKADYLAAINLHPGEPLEARGHARLANVAFDQDDYSTAIVNWTTALDNLDERSWKGDALYRIGECQQRLGNFDDADKTFARVVQEYADMDVAAKAQARQGVRGFYVQVGAFTKPADAATAVKAADAAGVQCRQISDHGLIVVRGGPYSSYTEALRARIELAAAFPDVIVGP
jgi:tetratricopeptide (TPR) repeat protein